MHSFNCIPYNRPTRKALTRSSSVFVKFRSSPFTSSTSLLSLSPSPKMSSSASSKRSRGPPALPKPSSSVVLLSPRNQILLLARVKTSSSFASAHVFPGGNVDTVQDGTLPPEDSFERHVDSSVYRLAALRECFEESGILLAKTNNDGAAGAEKDHGGRSSSSSKLVQVRSTAEREAGRRDIHAGRAKFTEWVAARGGSPDVEGLVPFTRFVTPTSVPKRFTTQMYVYFLPLDAAEEEGGGEGKDDVGASGLKGSANAAGTTTPSDMSTDAATKGGEAVVIPVPTSDGGVEHTAAKFLWPRQWLDLARRGDIIMYPPQVLLCSLIADFFPEGKWSVEELQKQRDRCLEFIKSGSPPWGEKVMSPDMILGLDDGRVVLGLQKPGHELEGSGRSGDAERVILSRHSKEGPRDVEVRWKADVLREWREAQGKDGGKEKL